MESNANSARWTVRVGSLAIACLLLGATAAFAAPCYACTSYCTQIGITQGFLSKAANGSLTKIGGTGYQQCGYGTACYQAVQAKCTEMCNACMALPTAPPANDCGSERCRTDTGFTDDFEPTSICNDICACGEGKFCQNLQIVGGGNVSTQNVRCGCPTS